MARHSDDKSKLIRILEETPLVNYACKKVGIGRTTFYRWVHSNPDFRREVERAIESGRSQWIEVAESALMKNVKNGTMDAVKFFLVNNAEQYAPKRPSPPPDSETKDPSRRKGGPSGDPDLRATKPMPPDLREQFQKTLRENGMLDELLTNAPFENANEAEIVDELEEERLADEEERRIKAEEDRKAAELTREEEDKRRIEDDARQREADRLKKLEDAITDVDDAAIERGNRMAWPEEAQQYPIKIRIKEFRRTFRSGEGAKQWDINWRGNYGNDGPSPL